MSTAPDPQRSARAAGPPPAMPRPIVEALPVWDRFVRIFHWSLVVCVLLNFSVLGDGDAPHQVLGYLATGLVVARIAWGFIGTAPARFTSFWPTPGRLARHLRALLRREPERHDGHNPLGALMMLTLMALVLALGVTGYAQTTDAYWGEAWLQTLHETLADGLIALAGLHAAAALIMGRLERTRLVRAMFTGIKERW